MVVGLHLRAGADQADHFADIGVFQHHQFALRVGIIDARGQRHRGGSGAVGAHRHQRTHGHLDRAGGSGAPFGARRRGGGKMHDQHAVNLFKADLADQAIQPRGQARGAGARGQRQRDRRLALVFRRIGQRGKPVRARRQIQRKARFVGRLGQQPDRGQHCRRGIGAGILRPCGGCRDHRDCQQGKAHDCAKRDLHRAVTAGLRPCRAGRRCRSGRHSRFPRCRNRCRRRCRRCPMSHRTSAAV